MNRLKGIDGLSGKLSTLISGQKGSELNKVSDHDTESKLRRSDAITLTVASHIKSVMDSDNFLADRAKRVQELKDLIAQGRYNPSLEQVALAVAEGIDEHIALSK